MSTDQQQPGLMKKLLDYIVEQAKDIDPKGFRLSQVKGFMKVKPDLQGLPGIHFDEKLEGDHIWLRVERLQASKPPAVPQDALGLILISDNPMGSSPSLDENGIDRVVKQTLQSKLDGNVRAVETAVRAKAHQGLKSYTPLWTAWAEGEKPRRMAIQIYGELFTLKHQLESETTAKPLELVWGIGVASWKLSYEERTGRATFDFQYPLLTQSLELNLDEGTLAIEVRPRAVGTRVEFDAFSACQVQGSAEVEKTVRDALDAASQRPVNPFDQGSYDHLLKLIAGNLHKDGSYVPDSEEFPSAGTALAISDGWVIFARPRSANNLIVDVERLKSKLSEDVVLPAGPAALVTPPSDETVTYEPVHFRGLSGGSGAGGSGKANELFFPLPYNHEQVTIVEQLERSPGICVQGPPGTGKTHTIANIVSHYLAQGKKVLVTSKGEKALEVLQSKIPADIRPLTVALLAGDREGLRQFQTSIESIIHNLSQLNVDVVRTQIDADNTAIDQTHAELNRIDRRVDEIATSQLSTINVDGVEMRAQKMAEMVLEGAKKYAWFDDALSLDPACAPPLTGADATALRDARRRLGQDLPYASARIPSSVSLLTASDISKLHQILLDLHVIADAESSGRLLALRASTPEVLDEARQLLDAVDTAATLAKQLEDTGEIWTADLRAKCRQSSYASERQALEALFDEIDNLIAQRGEFLKRPVTLPDDAATSPQVVKAVERAIESGKPFGMLSVGAGEAKAQVAQIKVAGLAPSTKDDWAHVQRFMGLHKQLLSFSTRWNEFAEQLSIPRINDGVQALRQVELVSTHARLAHHLGTNHDMHLPQMAQRVFADPPLAQLRGTSSQLREVGEHLRSHLTRADLAHAATQMATLREKLAGTSGAISHELRTFTDETLGDPTLTADRVVGRYSELVGEVRRIEGLSHEIAVLNDFASRIENAGATRLGARLRTIPMSTSGDDEVLPATWRDAWTWSRIKTHLDAIEAREEIKSLAEKRRGVETHLAKLYVSVVAKSAWLSTKMGASPKVLSALNNYQTAVRRIGKGTGTNAMRYRRDAQRAMFDAQGAVPCWIMNHNKVSETLPSSLGIFDLVIVDEASQSDLWALPSILRGKKILVVGDDKQVSPDAGFIEAVRIQELKDRFLSDQPFADNLTPEKSLYDLASSVYAANNVMLKEHFRCVPPIIAYSNHTFYQGSIQPLRLPRSSERIDPPLVDIFVSDGRRGAKDVNQQEALAIADEIEAMLCDERFAGRTIGVVSLLGIDQAKHVDEVVRSRCDAAELHRRKFDCGDARQFQGSERDIMFLSMVVDRANCKANSGNMFDQRFNVAASRARDRMYLVRSVTLADLSQADGLRRGLIGHFSKPLDVGEQDSQSLIDLCESGFERQVYTELFERGYRVTPQVKAGSFRIDMVVEGADDTRLAIECDGDEFHGPDRWNADMRRQRVLERAGWTFWRCFASTWSLHKDEVVKDLIDRLTAMGIEPIGALARIPSLVEYREWVATA